MRSCEWCVKQPPRTRPRPGLRAPGGWPLLGRRNSLFGEGTSSSSRGGPHCSLCDPLLPCEELKDRRLPGWETQPFWWFNSSVQLIQLGLRPGFQHLLPSIFRRRESLQMCLSCQAPSTLIALNNQSIPTVLIITMLPTSLRCCQCCINPYIPFHTHPIPIQHSRVLVMVLL